MIEPDPHGHSAPSNTDTKPQLLNIVTVYEDEQTRICAAELWNRVAELIEPASIRCTSWNLSLLHHPTVLEQAIAGAGSADVVIVSLHAASQPPAELVEWVRGWLPRRRPMDGSLLAIVVLDQHRGMPSDRVQEYLRSVARDAGLDFLLQQRSEECAKAQWALSHPENPIP